MLDRDRETFYGGFLGGLMTVLGGAALILLFAVAAHCAEPYCTTRGSISSSAPDVNGERLTEFYRLVATYTPIETATRGRPASCIPRIRLVSDPAGAFKADPTLAATGRLSVVRLRFPTARPGEYVVKEGWLVMRREESWYLYVQELDAAVLAEALILAVDEANQLYLPEPVTRRTAREVVSAWACRTGVGPCSVDQLVRGRQPKVASTESNGRRDEH